MKTAVIVILASCFVSAFCVRRYSEWRENFETKRLGSQWKGAKDHVYLTKILNTRAKDGGVTKALQIKYLKGKFGNESRVRYKVELKEANTYIAEFDVMFGENFDFKKGGKLPGFCGGQCTTGCKEIVKDGWSSRFLWKGENRLNLYIYDQDRYKNKKKNKKNRYCGTIYYLNYRAPRGKWINLRQELTINSPNQYDGVVRVFINGQEKFVKNDFRFRGNTTGAQVNRFYFTTFFGGSTADWAPTRDSYAYFDNFYIHQP